MRALRTLLPLSLLACAAAARAAVVEVTPATSLAALEAAGPGDEVVIAPGTYRHRVHLTARAPADRPIVIRAKDPANPPVWDLAGTLVEDAPGSYGAGDRGRGCWQIAGGTNYRISGIVFTNCRNAAHNSAGLRYYAGARGIVLRDCVFRTNDNGLTGGTEESEITVESSEFDRNGNLAASSASPTHNVYVYGGTFTLRYSYLHDPVQGQNLHLRARAAVVEYSWLARARSYAGDLMTDDDLSSGATQTLLLRGNVIVQGAQQNGSQVLAVYEDAGIPGMRFAVRLVNNTFVGDGGHAALLHLSNADGTEMSAELVNNVVSGTSVPVRVETAAAATVSGARNWLEAGVAPGALVESVSSASPGFADPAAGDFTLAAGSAAIGAAGPAADLPDREYYRDETVTRMSRARASVRDLGAFESTTTGPGEGLGGGAPPVEKGSGCGSGGAGWLSVIGAFVAWAPLRHERGRALEGHHAGEQGRGAPALLRDLQARGEDRHGPTR